MRQKSFGPASTAEIVAMLRERGVSASVGDPRDTGSTIAAAVGVFVGGRPLAYGLQYDKGSKTWEWRSDATFATAGYGDAALSLSQAIEGMVEDATHRTESARFGRELRDVEIFAEGTWNGVSFTDADLDRIVSSFDALDLAGRVPLKLGHDGKDARTDSAPALGWVTRVRRAGGKLLADFSDIHDTVYDAIRGGLYRNVSVELLRDVQADTRRIPWVLDAVALLGAAQPAVGILKDLQSLTMTARPTYAAGERLTFTMPERGGGDPADVRSALAEIRTQVSALAAENERLRKQNADTERARIADHFEFAIRSGRCEPSWRERFNRRFGDAATFNDAVEWLKDAPPVSVSRATGRPITGAGQVEAEPTASPARSLVASAKALMKRERITDFSVALQRAMEAQPELAEGYKREVMAATGRDA
jgi:hypothetical protein